jgi:hypothetical protein
MSKFQFFENTAIGTATACVGLCSAFGVTATFPRASMLMR